MWSPVAPDPYMLPPMRPSYTPQTALSDRLLKEIAVLKTGESFLLSTHRPVMRAFIAAALLRKSGKPLLVITPTREEGERFVADASFFLGKDKALFFPSWELLPFEEQSPHTEIVASRMEVLYTLSNGGPTLVVTTPRALLQKVLPTDDFIAAIEILKVDMELEVEPFKEKMESIGYSRMSLVEERGEMSIRGGIIDFFPPLYPSPVRIELFGETIESLRFFDPATQRSKETIDQITILPARELINDTSSSSSALRKLKERGDELGIPRDVREVIAERLRSGLAFAGMESFLPLFHERLETLFDYLPRETLLLVDRNGDVMGEAEQFHREVDEMAEKGAVNNRLIVRSNDLYTSLGYLDEQIKGRGGIFFNDSPPNGGKGGVESAATSRVVEIAAESNIDIRQDISMKRGEMLQPLVERLTMWREMGWQIILAVSTEGQAERLKELLEPYRVKIGVVEGVELPVIGKVWGKSCGRGGAEGRDEGVCGDGPYDHLPGDVVAVDVILGELSSGFRSSDLKLAIVTEDEIFGARVKRRPPPSRRVEAFLTQLQDLDIGDHIVHADHGIGIYKGLKRLKLTEIEHDFLLLEYLGGDKLYLPAQRLNLISKYHGVEGKVPIVDRLGGNGWNKTKEKVKKAVEEMAQELLELYAARSVVKGFSFSRPDTAFAEFEAAFEYSETPDQERTIREVIDDMERDRPMDRLVCGDVGYGKTEVAMRAAFNAAFDGKQVAILVPTTVLAQQHYNTFTQRFAPYPVQVDLLSRFRSPAEQRESVERLKRGDTDIIIGTHRLLQRDVAFNNLGLVVIDEEHRFGVRHKERLKQLRSHVDVLTLTATPIPRTLHMSFAGIRDLSIINTPPEERLAIKTTVMRFDETAIRDAIMRELLRGGQVFFVHNRVVGIEEMADRIRAIVPEARVAVAHGQMKPRDLEKVMGAFINKEYDILLSTSIIESGLDIPSANTIIINRADMFGLADIYQLRGRVGRSRHRAYAYLLVPPDMALTGDARKRLDVLRELSGLGAGFRIATHDLEIRGAGELLGSSQSGQIGMVGFEMYSQLLEEAVQELKGEVVERQPDPEVHLNLSAFLPEEYIPDTKQRLNLYKRMATVTDDGEVDELRVEVRDRFGSIPPLVDTLFKTVSLKLLLKRVGIVELRQKGKHIHLKCGDETQIDTDTLLGLIKSEPHRIRITSDLRIIYGLDDDDPIGATRYLLQRLIKGC